MRILVLNPNTSEGITARLMAAATPVASPGTELVPLTASRGVPYIATRAEAQIGGAIALEMLAERHTEFDAAIIAAFGDPGLMGARELFDLPVVGMAEAAMLSACMLGRRFSIVTFARALGPWYEECVDMHGLRGRLAGIRMLDGSFASVSDVQEEKEAVLVELANRAVVEDEADVVILAGAPLAGLAARVRDRIPVPVVDQMAAAVKQAEALVALQPRKASAGTFRRPDAKPTIGLAQALAARIEHR
ncbi:MULTISPECIES: aspartate/glutamate racemase family protein [unclassified Cupriavidus]|uniref:aspartate/glutamate racemase family protein n=1 Tax=unclassified Cupriavidus TaxID=2640874 RepID=UPI001055AAD1|nr:MULTISPECIES: aspartate/glutamate racemase family protein [unclassified Cupriavidus]MBF6992116.1 aspartate/glutamate racemase family protein [Cupriavidus sp. IK-TO18]TDF67867.1 Asp/Glu/hydantoin racemase [Cupriavidus sp. L7L]